MHRRHRPQLGEGEVERVGRVGIGDGAALADDGDAGAVDVGDRAHHVQQEMPAGRVGDVGGRVVQAEEAVGADGAFGDDLAVLVLGEAVDHHAVEAGDFADDAGAGLGQFDEGAGLDQFRDEAAAEVFVFPDAGGVLVGAEEFEDDVPAGAVGEAFGGDAGAVGAGKADEPRFQQVGRGGFQRQAAQLGDVVVADDAGEGAAEDGLGGVAEELVGVLAGIVDDEAVGVDGDEGAVGLDRADQVDLLAVAGVEVDDVEGHARRA